MDQKLSEETPVGDASACYESLDSNSAVQPTENVALKRALERVKRDAEAELHAGHHTHHNSHSSHNTCMII